ncbi:type II restriction endonuclease [Erysipelothrix rhusiopathiae]|nr:type II restriction endonuclease [Erysipelothrix rhusiopathiae]MDE9421731.1 type II restriction endonuclease [Erysipelothrix rhusiopathiae]
MDRNFEEWILEFKDSIATWDYYVDFDKVYGNVDKIKIELNLLNSLVGSDNIEEEFISLTKEYPKVIQVIPILLAKRDKEIRINDIEREYCYKFRVLNYPIEDYCILMRKSGLFDLLETSKIKDLTDYVKGVEVGMDTNARKNRTGKAMEDLVESYIIEAGFIKELTYFKEMTLKEVEEKFNLNLSTLSNQGKSVKRFDFVVKTNTNIYAIETNFYSGGGSKLNETARSYEMLASQSQNIKGFKFVWITDGKGWLTARNNLRQTFDRLDDIYNINDLNNKILKKVLI